MNNDLHAKALRAAEWLKANHPEDALDIHVTIGPVLVWQFPKAVEASLVEIVRNALRRGWIDTAEDEGVVAPVPLDPATVEVGDVIFHDGFEPEVKPLTVLRKTTVVYDVQEPKGFSYLIDLVSPVYGTAADAWKAKSLRYKAKAEALEAEARLRRVDETEARKAALEAARGLG